MNALSGLTSALLLVVLLAGCEAAAECTREQVEECTKGLFKQRDHVNATEFCGYNDYLSTCVRDLKTSCDLIIYDKLFLDGFRDAHDYLCSHQEKLLESNLTCIMTPVVKDRTKECTDSLEMSFDNLRDRHESTIFEIYHSVTELCGLFPAYTSCIEKVVEPFCGEGAADIATTAVDKMFAVLGDSFSCPCLLWFDKWWWAFVALVAAVKTLFFSICACAMYRCCCPKRECHHNQDAFPIYKTGTKLAKYKDSEMSMYTPLTKESTKTASSTA